MSSPVLLMTKSANKSEVAVGEVLTYEIVLLNDGDVNLDNILVTDLLAEELEFIQGSVKIDGVEQPDLDILGGIEIGSMLIGEELTITFDAKVVEKIDEVIENTSRSSYTYIDSETDEELFGENESNLTEVAVYFADLEITKDCNKKSVGLGDTITYTVKLKNKGDLILENVIFKDLLPEAVELVDNEIIVNGTPVLATDLENGVNVGEILVGEVTTIVYTVLVVGGSCDGLITNQAFADYTYVLPNETFGFGTTEVVSCKVKTRIQSFKQILLDKYIEIEDCMDGIEDVNDGTASVSIDNCYVIKTSKGTSEEGQILSGYKLIIHGKLQMNIEYTACTEDQQVHAAYFEVDFGSFIILPPDYVFGSNVEVTGLIEDLRFDKVDDRHLFVNAVILLISNK